MSLLFSMTVAGTIPLLAYYIIKVLLKETCDLRWRRWLLYISMIFYLCPFQRMKYELTGIWPDYFYTSMRTDEKHYLNRAGYIALPNTWGSYSLQSVWKIAFMIAWALVIVGFVGYQMARYVSLKKILLKRSEPLREEKWQERISGRHEKWIRYAMHPDIKTPFTIGLLRHWIILPDWKFTEEEKKMICLHEMTHIRNRDILKKIICLGIILLHWFNPAAWLLLYEYGVMSEQICDEKVALSLNTQEERKKYATLLVRMAVKDTRIPVAFADHLSKGEKNMRKRIDAIMKAGKRKAGIVPLLLVVSVFLSSLTAVAYQKEFAAPKEDFDGASEGDFVYYKDDELEKIMTLSFPASGSIFIEDATGKIWDFPMENGSGARAACDHTYVEGIKYFHYVNSSGGCTVKNYTAKMCTKCGVCTLIKLVGTTTYTECPH